MSWGGRSQVGNQQGMVLLIVLVSIALISSLIYSRVEGQRFQIYRVENELNLQQAQIMARSYLKCCGCSISRKRGGAAEWIPWRQLGRSR